MRWINHKQDKPTKGKRAKSVRKRPMPRWTRRSLRTLGVAAIFALALGGPAWLWQSGWIGNAMHSAWQSAATHMGDAGLRVDQILLQGRRHESPDRITRVLNIERGDPLLAVDLKYARERLETLPWIRTASIERQFPNTIRVKILERRPMALWQRENKRVLVDDEGTIITSRNLERFRDLLVVVGKDAPAHANALMTILAREPDLKQRVNAAVRIGDRRWNIRMDNGVDVRLPENDPEAAWRRFARLEREHKLLKQDLLSIDLRIPGQLIVRTRADRTGRNRKVSHRKGKNT